MASVLRMCNPYDHPFVLEYEDSQFKGAFAKQMNGLMSDLKNEANVTVEMRSQNEGIGEKVDGSSQQYTGCIGLLQQNLSDVMAQVVTYPIDAENIVQGDVVTYSAIQMFNSYSANDDAKRKEDLQIESCFLSVDPAVWCLCFLSLLLTLAVLCASIIMKVKMDRSQSHSMSADRYPLYQILVHIAQYGELANPSGPFKCLLFLILSFFSLLVLFYFNASISTDLVVVKPPSTVRTYKEHLDHRVSLMFVSGTDVYTHFKFAAQGSEEKRLWDMSVSKLTESGAFLELAPENVGKLVRAIFAREVSLVLELQFGAMAMKEGCGLILKQSKLDMVTTYLGLKRIKVKEQVPLLSQDAKARYAMKGYILSAHSSARTIHQLQRLCRKYLEHGLITKIESAARDANLLNSLLQLPKEGQQDLDIVEKCEQSVLIEPEGSLDAVRFVNMKHFIQHLIMIVQFNFGILFVELFLSFFLKRMNRVDRR